MKILLIGNYIPDRQQSMQRFTRMLEAGLIKNGHEVKVIQPPVFFGAFKMSMAPLSKWLGYIDKFFVFPAILRRTIPWADVVHICDHSNAFYTKYLCKIPHVVTCHDMLALRSALDGFSENPVRWPGKRLQSIILKGLNRSQKVACVSLATQVDLLKTSGLSKEKICLIYNGFNYPYSPMNKKEADQRLIKMGIDPAVPFIFHIGGHQWYKNRTGVIEIFKRLIQTKEFSGLRLILAGHSWDKNTREHIYKNKLKGRVDEIILPSDEDLRALYSTAQALLYPSLYEGFGWPIIEAQACGCLVFTSDRPAMTEVGGKGALYIDPQEYEEASVVVKEILLDDDKIDAIRKMGKENCTRFSTDNMIKAYVDLYQEACR